MGAPSTHDRQGSVECPYCGHQIARNVVYSGQIMHCQNCTSAVYAPRCDGGSDAGDAAGGCIILVIILFAIVIGIMCFGYDFEFIDIISSTWTWVLFVVGIIASVWIGYSSDG